MPFAQSYSSRRHWAPILEEPIVEGEPGPSLLSTIVGVVCRRAWVSEAFKVLGPWLAFRLVWRPFLRFVYRTLVKSYGYRTCDATAITHYVTICCAVALLLLSMYLNGQLYWACSWSVTQANSTDKLYQL